MIVIHNPKLGYRALLAAGIQAKTASAVIAFAESRYRLNDSA